MDLKLALQGHFTYNAFYIHITIRYICISLNAYAHVFVWLIFGQAEVYTFFAMVLVNCFSGSSALHMTLCPATRSLSHIYKEPIAHHLPLTEGYGRVGCLSEVSPFSVGELHEVVSLLCYTGHPPIRSRVWGSNDAAATHFKGRLAQVVWWKFMNYAHQNLRWQLQWANILVATFILGRFTQSQPVTEVTSLLGYLTAHQSSVLLMRFAESMGSDANDFAASQVATGIAEHCWEMVRSDPDRGMGAKFASNLLSIGLTSFLMMFGEQTSSTGVARSYWYRQTATARCSCRDSEDLQCIIEFDSMS